MRWPWSKPVTDSAAQRYDALWVKIQLEAEVAHRRHVQIEAKIDDLCRIISSGIDLRLIGDAKASIDLFNANLNKKRPARRSKKK